MQMAQRGKVIKTGGTLRIMNKQPYIKRSFSGSTGVYSGGTVKKLILDRLDNGIEPLITSVSTLTIGKKYRRKTSKKASKKASKGGSIKRKSSRKASKRKSSKRKASKRKSSRKASKRGSKRKPSKGGSLKRKSSKKRSFRPLKFKL
jgi:hypothetical protein